MAYGGGGDAGSCAEWAKEKDVLPYDPSLLIHPPVDKISSNFVRRMVVIDGCNVLYNRKLTDGTWLKHDPKTPVRNVDKLVRMVYELVRNGFEVIVALREHLLFDPKVQHRELLEELRQLELVRFAGIEDDHCILETAAHFHALIVSNDQYREFLPKYEKVIRRRVGFRFDDRKAPDVSKMHEKAQRWKFASFQFLIDEKPGFFDRALCSSYQPEYKDVQKMYRQIDPDYFEKRLEQLELMGGYLHLMHCLTVPGAPRPQFDFYELSPTVHTKFKDFKAAYDRFQHISQ